jgi:hypothetical protein
MKSKSSTNKNVFSMKIENLAAQYQLSCIDVLVEYSERHQIEMKQLVRFLNPSLKAKIKQEFYELNAIRKPQEENHLQQFTV